MQLRWRLNRPRRRTSQPHLCCPFCSQFPQSVFHILLFRNNKHTTSPYLGISNSALRHCHHPDGSNASPTQPQLYHSHAHDAMASSLYHSRMMHGRELPRVKTIIKIVNIQHHREWRASRHVATRNVTWCFRRGSHRKGTGRKEIGKGGNSRKTKEMDVQYHE